MGYSRKQDRHTPVLLRLSIQRLFLGMGQRAGALSRQTNKMMKLDQQDKAGRSGTVLVERRGLAGGMSTRGSAGRGRGELRKQQRP